jgi:hypothetical protein
MFTILKPEMRRCIDAFDPYLEEAGFNIESRHSIPNWDFLARQIYSPQIKDPKFACEFNICLWMTQNFFGNQAVSYKLNKKGGIEQNLEDLMRVKKRFRADISQKLDAPFTFLVNLDKLKIPKLKLIGRAGVLKVGNVPLDADNFNGRWDYFFFKYVHSSENPGTYQAENKVLERNEIYNTQITDEQWKHMKETGTLVPLINLGAYKNE